ncbi:MAG: HD domain-containing protein [Actinobacteria bacterium]|nr:HD domain-containing protein [Actinomycetota bacterium]
MSRERKLALHIYVYSVFITGLLILSYILLKYRNISLLGVVLFGALFFGADNLSVPLPKAGSVSVNFGFSLASLIIYGPSTALLVTLVCAFNIREFLRKVPYYRHLFNIGQFLISMGVASLAFESLYDRQSVSFLYPRNISVIFLCVLVFFISNTSLTASAISISERMNFINLWVFNFAWLIPSEIFLGAMAIAISFLYKLYSPFTLIFTSLPLIIAQYTYFLRIRERRALLSSIMQIVKVVEAKDIYTAGHSVRVAEYSEMIARELRLSEYAIEVLRNVANLHDLGKVQVDLSVLNKPGEFNNLDWEEMKKHPIVGYEIVKEITFLRDSADAILYHHERMDGKGYPYGKKGDEIPLFAKILCVADSYDAMTTERPYKKALSEKEAILELKRNSGTQFDPQVCEAFVKVLERRG